MIFKRKNSQKRLGKKLLSILLIGSMLLTGCSTSGRGSSSAETSKLVYANFRDLRDLNPHLYNGELFAQNLIFESLVKITEDGDFEPWLAESWEISEDGKEYVFKLREDVTFSDGEKFNAEAAKANFDAILDNADRHTWLESVRLMQEVDNSGGKSVEVTGEYELTLRLSEIKEIEVKVIPDNQTRVMALKNGEVDLIYGTNMIDAETYKEFESLDGFKTSISDPISTRMMIINTTDEILGDVKVRKAIQHATDRKTISESIFSGIESPADTVLAKTVPYADIDLKAYDYNLDTAKKLLDEAGWKEVKGKTYRQKDGKELSIVLNYCSDSVTEKTIAEFYQSELAKVGIKLEISGEEEQAYRDRMKAGDFDITFNISWGSPYDPQSFLAGMRMPVYGDYAAQQGLKEKAQIDETILKALTSTDEEKRQEYYTYVLTTLHEEAVYIPLTYERNRAVYNEKVKNVTFNASQFEVPMEKMKI